MTATPTPAPVKAQSVFEKLVAYVKTDASRVVSYVVTEGAALLTLAHVSSTSFEHEITVAGAAAIAALVNHARASHLIP